MKKLFSLIFTVLLLFISTGSAFAASDASQIDTGNTTFIIVSTMLVFLMTPALAMFYGGMARKKNVLNTMMNSFATIGIVSVQWVIIGFSIAFGVDSGFANHFIGNGSFIGLESVIGTVGNFAAGIPDGVFLMFQLMFAVITAALITGAFAGRLRFPAFIAFILLWTTIVYDPLAHWVWGVNGWLYGALKGYEWLHALDFAGGTVVHISSGIAGLVAAIVIGKRKGYNQIPMVPHNIPFVVLGAGLLWFGWFGFNAGSALAADTIATNAFITTNTAAATAVISWILVEYLHHGKPTVLGASTGAVVGLVAITPAAGFVTPISAIIIGLVVSPLCYFFISVVKQKFGYDDALDAFGCHGIGGIWGSIATGIFATTKVNPLGLDGLLYGRPEQLLVQIIAVCVTIVFSGVATFIILKVISLFTPLRATEAEEDEGLDFSFHGEDAYPDFATENSIA